MESLQMRIYETLADLESLRPSWDELIGEFSAATTFSTWEWLVPWWRAFGGGQQILVLAFFDSSSRLVGLAPFCLQTRELMPAMSLRVLRLLGDGSGDSDNLDFPVRAGYEEQMAAMLLDYLAKEGTGWDYCEFNTMPPDSAVGSCLLRQLELPLWTSFCHQSAASVVSLPETWEGYLAQLSAKERGKIGYRTRHLEKKYRVRYYKCEDEAQIPSCLSILFDLHQKRWQSAGEPGSFISAARRQFYGEFASLVLASGRLEFWFLELDDQPAAAQFGFRFAETVFSLQEGYDPAYASDSVGYVLRAQAIRRLIGGGVRHYHFLAGDGSSKARWGTHATHFISTHFARSGSRGSLYLQSIHGAAAGKEWLRAHLPGNVWAGLHRLNSTIKGVWKFMDKRPA